MSSSAFCHDGKLLLLKRLGSEVHVLRCSPEVGGCRRIADLTQKERLHGRVVYADFRNGRFLLFHKNMVVTVWPGRRYSTRPRSVLLRVDPDKLKLLDNIAQRFRDAVRSARVITSGSVIGISERGGRPVLNELDVPLVVVPWMLEHVIPADSAVYLTFATTVSTVPGIPALNSIDWTHEFSIVAKYRYSDLLAAVESGQNAVSAADAWMIATRSDISALNSVLSAEMPVAARSLWRTFRSLGNLMSTAMHVYILSDGLLVGFDERFYNTHVTLFRLLAKIRRDGRVDVLYGPARGEIRPVYGRPDRGELLFALVRVENFRFYSRLIRCSLETYECQMFEPVQWAPKFPAYPVRCGDRALLINQEKTAAAVFRPVRSCTHQHRNSQI